MTPTAQPPPPANDLAPTVEVSSGENPPDPGARHGTPSKPSPPAMPSGIFPGSTGWVAYSPGSDQEHPVAEEELSESSRHADLIALPVAWVTSYPFWLETTSPKDIPDLLALQCERRGLIQAGENPAHRVVRTTENRTLVQVLLLSPKLPGALYEGIDSRYEASPRCREFPPAALCVWREQRNLCVALTPPEPPAADDSSGAEPVHFQAWPHREIQAACLADLRVLLLMAQAQEWTSQPQACYLIGDFTEQERKAAQTALEIPTHCRPSLPAVLPRDPVDLSPSAVRLKRQQRTRQRQLVRVLAGVAVFYLLFVCYEIVVAISLTFTNQHLQQELDRISPAVQEMQNTARLFDTLKPAMDPDLFPLEILRHVMEALPESGVRLTRFEILQGNLEIAGEASTAREAFTFLSRVQELEPPDLIVWEEPPPPVPLPNNTTRFNLRGNITEAYRDPQ